MSRQYKKRGIQVDQMYFLEDGISIKKKDEDPKIIFLLADVFTILEEEVYEGMSYEDLAL